MCDTNLWYNKKFKGIPSSEKICVHYKNKGEITYIITADRDRKYKLYKCNGDTATYTKHKSNDPNSLYKYMEGNND